MELLKIALEWAKAEVFSSKFFVLFAILFLLGSMGFWQLGKTITAKSFVLPMLVAGILLLMVGVGLWYTNAKRLESFPQEFTADAETFVTSEIKRAENTINEYNVIVFKVIPCIIIVAALLVLFIDKPVWRAIGITTIALMMVILIVDSNANARMQKYHEDLRTQP